MKQTLKRSLCCPVQVQFWLFFAICLLFVHPEKQYDCVTYTSLCLFSLPSYASFSLFLFPVSCSLILFVYLLVVLCVSAPLRGTFFVLITLFKAAGSIYTRTFPRAVRRNPVFPFSARRPSDCRAEPHLSVPQGSFWSWRPGIVSFWSGIHSVPCPSLWPDRYRHLFLCRRHGCRTGIPEHRRTGPATPAESGT